MVKKDKLTGLWKTDFRVLGKRLRQSFESRDEAREFETGTKLKAKTGLVIMSDVGKTLDEGFAEFIKLETNQKETASDEKAFLREFYRYAVHKENLTHFTEIKLIHLNRYQRFLGNLKLRTELWEIVESKRKKEIESRGEEYVISPKPKSGLSGSSVNRHLNSICDLLRWSKKWGWIETNPTEDLSPVEENPTERISWDNPADISTAIRKAKPWAARVFYIIAVTGIRPIGCKRMTWSDVDFENKRFKIHSKKGRDGKMRSDWVLMTEDLFKFFMQMWAERTVGKYGNLVFHSAAGMPLNTNRLSVEMARITKEMGLVGYTLYGFRHGFGTAITNPSEDGIRGGNIELARRALVHSNISQTQKYNHTKDETLRKELENVSKERNILWGVS